MENEGAHTTEAPTPTPTPVDPVTYQPPTVEINGARYQLRRLGVKDVFTVAKILGTGLSEIKAAGGVRDGAALVNMMIAALVEEEHAVMTLLAGTIGLKADDLYDAERFPLDSIFTLVEALAEHEDLRGFFTRSAALADKLTAGRKKTPTQPKP